jgi:hypothetical protein
MTDREMEAKGSTQAQPMLRHELGPRERDIVVRMFLRSYARMEVLHKHASYYRLHAYASFSPFIFFGGAGLVLACIVVLLIVSVSPPGIAHWVRSFWTWVLIGLALFWVVEKLIDRRIAHIPRGERPVDIEEFHTVRERRKVIPELVTFALMIYVVHECLSRIYFSQ